MAAKRKQDEKNLKLLRKLASNEHNKKCFDCGQRGPTYVNMTIGAFVCTSCSGLLRGLNPPQRVKSISMTSFTQTEIEQLQKSGNEYCRRVWLGLWNSHLPPEPDSRDEQRVKDFLIKKYEKKAYYVPPDQVKPVTVQKEKEPEVRPLKSLLGQNTPKVQVSQTSSSSSVGSIKQPPPITSSSTQPVAVAPPPGSTVIAGPTAAAQPKRSSQDLLGELGGDPFAAPSQQSQAGAFGGPAANAFGGPAANAFGGPAANAFGGPAQGPGGFADFGQAFGGSQQSAFPASGFPPAGHPPPATSHQPNQNAFGAFCAPAAAQPTNQASFAAFTGAPIEPTPSAPVNQASKSFADLSLSNSTPSAGPANTSNADRYSALSELDSIFSNPSGSSTSVFGGGAPASTAPSAFGQSPPKSTASGFGQPPSQGAPFGAPANQASSSSTLFGGPPATQAPVAMFGGAQAAPHTGGMEANPFGGFASAPAVGHPAQQQATQPNPFMVQPAAQPNGMFGAATQAGAYAWGGAQQQQQQPVQATAGYGQGIPQQNPYGQYMQQGAGAQPGMMQAQPGMVMGPAAGGGMQMNGGVNRGVPAGAQGGMNLQQGGMYGMQAQAGYGAVPYNKAMAAGGQAAPAGFGQMAPVQQPQQAAAPFGTWNPNGGGAMPQQSNPFMGQSALGMPPKAQSSNPFM